MNPERELTELRGIRVEAPNLTFNPLNCGKLTETWEEEREYREEEEVEITDRAADGNADVAMREGENICVL